MKTQAIEATGAVMPLDGTRKVPPELFGARAEKLARLSAIGLPVPAAVALSVEAVRALAAGGAPPQGLLAGLGGVVSVRSSPGERAWGGPAAILGVGSAGLGHRALAARLGARAALEIERRFIATYAVRVARLDAAAFEAPVRAACAAAGVADPGELDESALAEVVAALAEAYGEAASAPFPAAPEAQLAGALGALVRDWEAPTARILRGAKGAPETAGLGLIVQAMAFGTAPGTSGAGRIQTVAERTGAPAAEGWFLPRALGPEARVARERLALAGPGESLEAAAPEALAALEAAAARAATGCGDAMALEFVLEDGRLSVLDAVPARRSARASVRIAVDLAKAGAIGRDDALLRVEPLALVEHLHPAVDPGARRDVFARGIPASPGAASGRLLFTAEDAQAAAAQDEPGILVRTETGPDDIRGMHAARAVLTLRGGITSHAAVIARGIGLPCVVGAGELRLDLAERRLTAPDGRVFHEGAAVTLDGTSGEVLAGAPTLIPPLLDGAFLELLDWADAARRLGVRANADTAHEARVARDFHADGIGLCRTEHMFYEADRITVMGEMILADTVEERRAALERLLPMQRADFEEIFTIMAGKPVTIRLLDPPLHEFLPRSEEAMRALADATALTLDQVRARAAALAEFNPMLGLRGVRLGITIPEIYEMQARAIFEAAVAVTRGGGAPVVPEIMIPLVSANREVELVKARVEAVAHAVEAETGTRLDYRIGVMVETPRAALRSGDLAASSAFLSFGTNDLTQMTYGLSRDDAGRFMRAYVAHGVFVEDPFHSLDLEGVGELMLIAARRGRARNPTLTLGLCGEHGGDPPSVRFCKLAGFDYVSCSPYRVPIARLAAAQATILAEAERGP
jgi:pyruvate, orthophosphate dikinase